MEDRSDEWAVWFATSPKSDRLHLSAVSFFVPWLLTIDPRLTLVPFFALGVFTPQLITALPTIPLGGLYRFEGFFFFFEPLPLVLEVCAKAREQHLFHRGRENGIQPTYREKLDYDNSESSCSPVHWGLIESARQRTLQLGHRHTVGFLSGGLSRCCYRYVHLFVFRSLII